MLKYTLPQQVTIFVVTLIVAMVLTILPLPNWAQWERPEWVLLVLIFWVGMGALPIGIGTLWLIGLAMDLLTGTVLGQHAFAYCVVGFVVMLLRKQFNVLPVWQQILLVLLFLTLNLAIQSFIMGFSGSAPRSWDYWMASLISVVIWPWVTLLLRGYRFARLY